MYYVQLLKKHVIEIERYLADVAISIAFDCFQSIRFLNAI